MSEESADATQKMQHCSWDDSDGVKTTKLTDTEIAQLQNVQLPATSSAPVAPAGSTVDVALPPAVVGKSMMQMEHEYDLKKMELESKRLDFETARLNNETAKLAAAAK